MQECVQQRTQGIYLGGTGNGDVNKSNEKIKFLVDYKRNFLNYADGTTWVRPIHRA